LFSLRFAALDNEPDLEERLSQGRPDTRGTHRASRLPAEQLDVTLPVRAHVDDVGKHEVARIVDMVEPSDVAEFVQKNWRQLGKR
jgi:hypothetical protein